MIVAIGFLSGILTTSAWLPQLWRTWQRGKADDISFGYLGVLGAGIVGWIVYGSATAQPAVLVPNVVTFALLLGLTGLKVRPRRSTLGH